MPTQADSTRRRGLHSALLTCGLASLLGASCVSTTGGGDDDAGVGPGTGGANSGGVGGGRAGSGGSGSGGATGSGGLSGTGGEGGTGGGATGGRTGAGGAPGVGGAPVGTGGSGSGGAGGLADCGILPVNPNATAQARKLLCYLYSQYGNHVLSGQQETSWASNPDVDVNYIFTNTGKYPVIRGLDYLYTGTSARGIAWWNAGGIPMICYHMGAPTLSDTFQSSQMAVPGGIDAVLTPGTAQYTSFVQRLDYAAGELLKLQAANAAVIWRPFHEAGGTWFWWSMEGASQYKRLWIFMYDYFTTTKGLNNLIWLHPFDGTPPAAFFPGKAYVDLAGSDTYASNTPFASLYTATRAIVGTTIPISLHENGLMPDPAIMFGATKTPWVLFNTWADTFLTVTNTVANVKAVYANSFVVTRDEVPSLK
jgi:hypothetical protein